LVLNALGFAFCFLPKRCLAPPPSGPRFVLLHALVCALSSRDFPPHPRRHFLICFSMLLGPAAAADFLFAPSFSGAAVRAHSLLSRRYGSAPPCARCLILCAVFLWSGARAGDCRVSRSTHPCPAAGPGSSLLEHARGEQLPPCLVSPLKQ
jgi:hypothetical protein